MGITFLTPFDSLFALAAAVPLGALWLARRRADAVRRLFSLPPQRGRALVAVAAALTLVPCLVGVAAAQPVVVRQRPLQQRVDAQAFFVFDTSLSMTARRGPGQPTRLARAKRDALRLALSLGDIPVGIATMTDRTLPDLMPTTDLGLIERTLRESVGIDRPPPSLRYKNRATTLDALVGIGSSQFYPLGVRHPILVVFTDGESAPLPANFTLTLRPEQIVPPLFVHVWSPGERIYVKGRIDPKYLPDPTSGASLDSFATLMRGRVFGEGELGSLLSTIHAATGKATAQTTTTQFARVALAPWFVLAGVLPLGFLLYRRNL